MVLAWLGRWQTGKVILSNGGVLRVVKFPADKNFYFFRSEVDEIAKPRVFSVDYVKLTQEAYEKDAEIEE